MRIETTQARAVRSQYSTKYHQPQRRDRAASTSGAGTRPEDASLRRSWAVSLNEGPPGQVEEHVLQRGPPHQGGDRRQATGGNLLQRRLTVVGIDQDAVRQNLQPAPDTLKPVHDRRVALGAEPHLENLSGGELPDQRAWAALSHDPPAVDHDQPVAQLLCLVH